MWVVWRKSKGIINLIFGAIYFTINIGYFTKSLRQGTSPSSGQKGGPAPGHKELLSEKMHQDRHKAWLSSLAGKKKKKRSCWIWSFFSPDGIHFRRQPEHHHCLSFAETNSSQIKACFHLELLFYQLLWCHLCSCLAPSFALPSFPLVFFLSFS